MSKIIVNLFDRFESRFPFTASCVGLTYIFARACVSNLARRMKVG